MSLALLSNILGKRGITHKQSKADHNFVQVYELIDGRSVPVLQVNIVDGSFLEMPHYAGLTDKDKRTLVDAKSEYKWRLEVSSVARKKPLIAGKQNQWINKTFMR